MIKNTVLAAIFAASSLVCLPSAASAQTISATPYPECALNCVWIATLGGGYWICETQMDCVNPN